MTGKTLSVVLPNFNHGHLLARAVEAIFGQSRPPDEFILIDDGSTDDSARRIEALKRDHPRIRLVKHPVNRGTNACVAEARALVTGEYLYLASADDQVLPGLFERTIDLLDQNPEAAFCSARTLLEDSDGAIIGELATPPVLAEPGFIPPQRAKELLRRHGGWFRCNTAVYRRQRIEDIGGFDPGLGTYGDGFVCMVFAARDGCCFIPEPGGIMRVGHDNASVRAMSDVDTAVAMFSHARTLMTTVYGHLFPDSLVAAWDKRWRYAVAAEAVRRGTTGNGGAVLGVLPRPAPWDRFAVWLAGVFPRLFSRATIAYLGLRLVPGDLMRGIADRAAGTRQGMGALPRVRHMIHNPGFDDRGQPDEGNPRR